MNSYLSLLFQQNFIKESISEFVRKVFLLLHTEIYQDAICWHADCKTIMIKNCSELVEVILPKVFKQKTLKSFIRQLNMYNFKKIKRENNSDYLYFQNEHFVKGNVQNLIFIKRKQRGYVEKSKLQIIQSKSILQKYNIFIQGVFTKLKQQCSKYNDKYTTISTELSNFTKPTLNITVEDLPQVQKSGQIVNPIIQQQRTFYNMFESFHSNLALPMFKSNISIGNQLTQQ